MDWGFFIALFITLILMISYVKNGEIISLILLPLLYFFLSKFMKNKTLVLIFSIILSWFIKIIISALVISSIFKEFLKLQTQQNQIQYQQPQYNT